jgi:putative membrane protein
MNLLTLDALLAYLHILAIFLTGFFLLLEWIRCREPIALNRARLLVKMDGAYALSALSALATGLLRVFYGVKGSAFYLENPVFYAKVGVFLFVAALSIPVTLAYFRWRKDMDKAHGEVTVPSREVRRVRALLLAEIVLLALLPALAVMMARGMGN